MVERANYKWNNMYYINQFRTNVLFCIVCKRLLLSYCTNSATYKLILLFEMTLGK